jgi:23S rRNA (pseudouridine1915-N3)-methyltransferase
MKKIELVCVGRIKEKYFLDALAEYQKRLKRFCGFVLTELCDAPDGVGAADTESAAVIGAMGGYKILLDRTGSAVSSEEFSKTIETAFVNSAPKVQIIIGGSRGVNGEVRALSDKVFSFGAVTYPHKLMRVIAAEQIYRAMCIANNAPYHK